MFVSLSKECNKKKKNCSEYKNMQVYYTSFCSSTKLFYCIFKKKIRYLTILSLT